MLEKNKNNSKITRMNIKCEHFLFPSIKSKKKKSGVSNSNDIIKYLFFNLFFHLSECYFLNCRFCKKEDFKDVDVL